MEVSIIAHPNSKHPHIEEDLMGTIHVYVKEPPLEGKANQAVLEALAEHLKLKKNQLVMIRGEKSKTKVFKIC